MERTISMMMGPGSINHNNRKFIADNVDRDRVKDNVVLVNQNLKKVYHELFDEALKKYNEKQTRKDRKIKDYYEHVRHDKQLKQFYEVIVQVGNKDDMNCEGEYGDLAKDILWDYMEGFQERNPNLKVFNAVIHMDEATPHLHINFVPFSTDNKRGLETQVSLKSALKQQGIVGSGRRDTEWNRWIEKEKEACAVFMARYGVKWNQLGTHKEHLSVLEYKKQERIKEVNKLEEIEQRYRDNVFESKCELHNIWQEKEKAQKELADINEEMEQKKIEASVQDEKLLVENQKLEDGNNLLRHQKKQLQVEIETLKEQKMEHISYYNKSLQELTDKENKLEEEIADKESTKAVMDVLLKDAEQEVAEKQEEVKQEEQKLSWIKEFYNQYRESSVALDKMVDMQSKIYELEEENATLRRKLQQAYDFMKSKFLNGISMFEEFTRSIGAKVQERWEERNRGAR